MIVIVGSRDVVMSYSSMSATSLAEVCSTAISSMSASCRIATGRACYALSDGGRLQDRAGSIATYYPEANALVALDHYDVKSGTPSYKSTPVLLCASTDA